MKKTWLIGCLALLLFVLAVSLFVACGQSPTTTPATPTVSAAILKGKTEHAVSAASLKALAMPNVIWNPNYPHVITTPESYGAGTYRVRLFKGLSDTSPYLLASMETPGNPPGHFNLTSTATQMAVNSNYPSAGTYTYFIPTLGYIEQTIPSSKIDFSGINKFRVMMSSYGSYQRGDILAYKDNQWQWITTSESGPSFSTTRLSNALTVDWGSDMTAEVNGHIVFEPTDCSFEGITIPSSPSGTYIFTFIFDIADCFAFNDVNGNGIFEPGKQWPQGDIPSPEAIMTKGMYGWGFGPPVMKITVTNEAL